MKHNLYVIVFGILALILLVGALSTIFFNGNTSISKTLLGNLPIYGPAPEIRGIAYWINSPPLNLSQLRGKVVLIDFWTYSCINCIRAIPYLNAWQGRYGSNGLVIIGVHTPEFQFETNYTNVKNAVQRFGIKYPVAMDSNYATWIAYNNHYWPSDYLIDKDGNVREIALGEGGYNTTESNIRLLLRQAGYNVSNTTTSVNSTVNFSRIGTPEIYLGYKTERGPLGNKEGFSPGNVVFYSQPNITQANLVYLSGSWLNAQDGIVSVNDSKMYLVYNAKSVNIVASGSNSTVTVKIDGKDLKQDYLGNDVTLVGGVATGTVGSPKLYNLISGPSYGQHELEIDSGPGLKVYTFTFG